MSDTLLFFDLDGTLMVNPFWSVIFPTAQRTLSALTGESEEAVFARILHIHEQRMATFPPDNPRAMDWDETFAEVAAAYGVTFSLDVTALVEAHAAPPYTSLIDESLAVLSALKNGQRRLVVATMGLARYQVPVLKGLGLYPLFDDILAPDLTGYLKTDPRFYARYLDSRSARRYFHVGDQYHHDVLVPKSMGVRPILRLPLSDLAPLDPLERPAQLKNYAGKVPAMPPQPDILPDAVIVHLRELLEVIPRLEAESLLD